MQDTNKRNKNTGHIPGRRLARIAIVLVGLGLLATIGGVAGLIGAYYYVEPGLPQAATIRDIPLQIPLRIYSRDGYLISEIGERRRILVTFDEIPPHVVDAFVAAEDRRFFEHPGIDYRGILRAFFQLVATGNIESGGSTLTQQLARDYFLTREQRFTRKLREAFLAYKIEQEFTKQQIMALFLNRMFFGQRAYGVAAAAQVYFDKPLADVNVAEAATLAGVLPAPSRYNPVRSAQNATRRRGYVLGRMRELEFISEDEYRSGMELPMESSLYGAAVELHADYVAEMVRREMLNRYGDATYTAGYQVVTSLDANLQRGANYALRNGLLQFARRRGYVEHIASFELPDDLEAQAFDEWPTEILDGLDQYAPGGLRTALVLSVGENNTATAVLADGERVLLPWSGINWAKPFIDVETTGPKPESAGDVLARGDLIYVMPTTAGGWALARVPAAQGAVVSVDPYDGAILSLAGGFDFATSKFNRVTQAFRQPGSSFKPFIYSAALENGNTPATIVNDAPVVINSSELEAVWRPINYSGRFYGPTRMREALVRSMNLVSVRLLLYETGIGNAIRHIAKFGFGDAALPRNGSLALGGGNASPLDMAQGYAIIANGGFAIKPYVIDAIYGPEGETLYRAEPLVVCEPCEAGGDTEHFRFGAVRETLSLEAMADVAMTYRPNAATAPDLFRSVNAAPHALSAQNMFLVQDMMRDVIRRGTGRKALVLGRGDLSGKTGTSNDRRDAWFGGFNGDIASVVWVGYDNDQPLGPGEEGSRTALPIWIDFMRIALSGVPENQMAMPRGIVTVKINRSDGCPARAGQTDTIFEVFMADNVPDCESVDELPDIFNDISGSRDALRNGDVDGEEDDENGEEDEAEEPEPLF